MDREPLGPQYLEAMSDLTFQDAWSACSFDDAGMGSTHRCLPPCTGRTEPEGDDDAVVPSDFFVGRIDEAMTHCDACRLLTEIDILDTEIFQGDCRFDLGNLGHEQAEG